MQLLGSVSFEECEELKRIYRRKTALQELALTLATTPDDQLSNNQFYEKLVDDLADCNQNMMEWWNKIASKHGWNYSSQDSWRIDFETGEIYLAVKNNQE